MATHHQVMMLQGILLFIFQMKHMHFQTNHNFHDFRKKIIDFEMSKNDKRLPKSGGNHSDELNVVKTRKRKVNSGEKVDTPTAACKNRLDLNQQKGNLLNMEQKVLKDGLILMIINQNR